MSKITILAIHHLQLYNKKNNDKTLKYTDIKDSINNLLGVLV